MSTEPMTPVTSAEAAMSAQWERTHAIRMPSRQVIPAEAVDAAAQAAAKDEDASNWDDEPDYYRNGWLNRMEVALEAAAPHINARTLAYLDESVRMISSDPEVKDYERGFDDAIRGMSAKVKRLLNGQE